MKKLLLKKAATARKGRILLCSTPIVSQTAVNRLHRLHCGSLSLFRSFATKSSGNQEEGSKGEQQQESSSTPPPPPPPPRTPLLNRLFKFLLYLSGVSAVAAYGLIKYYKLEALIPRDIFEAGDSENALYTGKEVNTGRQFGDGIIRFLRSAFTVGWVSLDYLFTLRGVPPGEEREKLKKELHARCAKFLVESFIKNGGIYIKAGQTIASMNHVLPQEYVDAFAQCQDQCQKIDADQIEQVFIEEFGNPPEHFFSEFDKIPIAAASLAQVHRARFKNGDEVAVKVQYPGVRGRLVDDVWTIAFFVNIVTKVFPDFKFKWLLDEFQESLPKELDFIREARNNERTKKNLKNRYDVTTPKIYWSLTTKRVLTMEFIHGCKINDLSRLSELKLDPVDVSRVLSEVFSEQMFIHGFVHCDPHPGNILVRKKSFGPELVLLDHGLYREVTDDFRMDYCNLWKSVVKMDEDQIIHYASKLGANEAYQLFATMLTSREWDKNNKGLTNELTEDEKLRLKRLTFENLGGIAEVLNNVPRQMLLLFKCNDLLRSVQYDLKVPIVYFTTMARIAQQGINNYQLSTVTGAYTLAQWAANTYESLKLNLQLEGYTAALYVILFMKEKFGIDIVKSNLLMNKMKIIYEQ